MRKIDLERRLSGKDILRTVKRSPVAIAVLVLLAVFPYLCSNIYLMNVVIEVFFFAALGVAWNVLGGLAKQISWASACFFTIGAYAGIMMYLSVKLSPWISMFIGIIAACLFALVIGAPCFRLRGVFFSIATISCTTILRQCLIVFKNVTGGSVGLNFGIRKNYSLWMLTFKSKIDFYYIALIWMLICVAIFVFVKRSRLGYYLRAVREDEAAASSLGIVPSSLKTKAFLISASMMSVTGTLYVFRLGYVDPNALCAHDISVKIGLIAILGGMGTTWGPVLGAFIIIPLLELCNYYLQDFAGGGAGYALYGLLIVLIVLLRPSGLITLADVIREKLAKRKAARAVKGV